MREIFAQALESQKLRPSDNVNFGVLLDDFGHPGIMQNTSDKSTLSDVISRRQCVRISWFSMA
ncbi:hypothetical protein C8J31_1584, partial [Rhizobium sp. PP-CC-2G-626]